jgi:hypothetical protein
VDAAQLGQDPLNPAAEDAPAVPEIRHPERLQPRSQSRVEQNLAIPEQLAPEAATAQVPPPHQESAVAQPGPAEELQAIVSRRSSRAKRAAAGLIVLLIGGGVVVITSEYRSHVAPQAHSAVAATGAQTAVGVGPAHPTATTSQSPRAGATGKPLAGSTRPTAPRAAQPATANRTEPRAHREPHAAGRYRASRSQRLVQRAFEIAIFYDALQRSDGKVAGTRTTCIPAAGSTANNASTTTYNCTAFVHANSSDPGSRYRYTGTVDVQSGIVAWHFDGAE